MNREVGHLVYDQVKGLPCKLVFRWVGEAANDLFASHANEIVKKGLKYTAMCHIEWCAVCRGGEGGRE